MQVKPSQRVNVKGRRNDVFLFQLLLSCMLSLQQLGSLLLLDRAGISRIIQLLALEQAVEMPAPSTKHATSSTQDLRQKVLTSSA
jgi:hypothetical protein